MILSDHIYVAENTTWASSLPGHRPTESPAESSSFYRRLAAVEKTARSLRIEREHTESSVEQIIHAVAIITKVSSKHILGPHRNAPYARARHLAMYIVRKHLGLSYPSIAAAFNRRNHTTVFLPFKEWDRKKIHFTQNKRDYLAVLSRLEMDVTEELVEGG